ncbi:MAG: ATP--guanido phosphotransferase [bacterium]
MNEPAALLSHAAIRRGAPWLSNQGPHSDVVLSSRVRLARNLGAFAFLSRCSATDRTHILAACRKHVVAACQNLPPASPEHRVPPPTEDDPARLLWVEVHRLSAVDRQLLAERHLISKEHAKGAEPRAAAITLPDERLSVMVNEEDHLRIQVLHSGLALADGYTLINEVDDRIESGLDYAFLPRFGYLTACPTNVGIACRMSVMLHLPAVRLTGRIEQVRRAAKDMCLALRGFQGEGSESAGDLYQISNQTTFGKTEAVVMQELQEHIVPQVIEFERRARHELLSGARRIQTADQCWRALGLLRSARQVSTEEALATLSLVRLGVHLGLFEDTSSGPAAHPAPAEPLISQLIVLTQPAHLQRLAGRELSQQERRIARADLLRTALGG